jgi:hypothetical protein
LRVRARSTRSRPEPYSASSGSDIASAPFLAASIFPDILNVVLAGWSAADGPFGLLAVEEERPPADRHLTTAEEA